MKRVAILQSNYIPWKGYFDLIAAVDEFILCDDVQYTRHDWRNRNRIKTPHGLHWLTVPVKVKDRYSQTILDTEIDGSAWASVHWKSLLHHYRRAPHFQDVAPWLEPIYLAESHTHLSPLNHRIIEAICNYLGIETVISTLSGATPVEGKTKRLVHLCSLVDGTEYISGPAAKAYIEENVFREWGIKLTWFDYCGYPEYPQLWGEFIHKVTILDLLFNCGKDAPRYMRYVRT